MNKRRVVITGLGAITPIGVGADVFFENLPRSLFEKNGK